MLKPELIKALSEQEDITQIMAGSIVDSVMGLIAESIQRDGRFEYPSFGVFKLFRSAAVSRPNPQDRSKLVHTPARNTVKFKPSPALKALVNP